MSKVSNQSSGRQGQKSNHQTFGEPLVTLEELTERYGSVLQYLGDSHSETKGEQDLDPKKIDSLRLELFNWVFDYDSAVEMWKWSQPADEADRPAVEMAEWAKLSPEERENLEKTDPWQAFYDSEFEQRALLVELLSSSMNLWHSVPRRDSVKDLGDSVFGSLLAKLGDVEVKRLGGMNPPSSLEERFRDARKAAWKVVVEEVEKRIIANKKPRTSSYARSQAQSDAVSSSHSDLPAWLRQCIGTPEERLTRKYEERFAKGALGVVSDQTITETWLTKIHDHDTPPTKELVAGLFWTAAHLPLCLMTPAAAAKTVLEILRSGVNPKVLGEGQNEATFTQSFRQLRRDRNLSFFVTHYPMAKKAANIISGFVLGKDDAESVDSIAPLRDENSLNGGDEGVPREFPEAEERRVDQISEEPGDSDLDDLPAVDWPEGWVEPGRPVKQMPEGLKRECADIRSRQEERDLANRQAHTKEHLLRYPDPHKFASLKVKEGFSVAMVENIRFRFEFFEEGMISQEDPTCK